MGISISDSILGLVCVCVCVCTNVKCLIFFLEQRLPYPESIGTSSVTWVSYERLNTVIALRKDMVPYISVVLLCHFV